jgi:hypothetical protein
MRCKESRITVAGSRFCIRRAPLSSLSGAIGSNYKRISSQRGAELRYRFVRGAPRLTVSGECGSGLVS